MKVNFQFEPIMNKTFKCEFFLNVSCFYEIDFDLISSATERNEVVQEIKQVFYI